MLGCNSKKNVDSVSDHNARLLEKYRVSFNSIEQINYTNRTFFNTITLNGSSHTIEEWLTSEDPGKRAGFQAAAALYIPEALYFLERLLPYMINMRQLLPFLEEEDRLWAVLNTNISTMDVKKLEQTLAEKDKILEETTGSLSQSEIKKQQAEIRTIKDLIRIKNEPSEAVKQLVKDAYQLQLSTAPILNQAYQHLLELWNGSLREDCPLPLNRSETVISDIKNSNIEQLIGEIEDLVHNSEVRLKKPLFGRETDKSSFFNDTHKRTNTLSQSLAKDEETEIKDPVELYLKLQRKRVYLLDGFNKVLSSVIYNAVGNEGILQCERYEADYEKGAKKWQRSKQLPEPLQANDNHIAVVAKWIYKNVLGISICQKSTQRKTNFFEKFITKKSTQGTPVTPRVNKSASYSPKELEEINKLEHQVTPLAEELMQIQLPLTQKEREKYLALCTKFDVLVKLRPEYELLQKEIKSLLAPPDTKSKVVEGVSKSLSLAMN